MLLNRMEINFPLNFTTCFLTFAFIFLIVNKWKKSNSRVKKTLPPGPWRLPIIGHIHHIVGTVPHHSLRDLANKYGPLMHLKIGEVSTIVVTSPALAKKVLVNVDPACAAKAQTMASKIVSYDFSGILFSRYGEYWKEIRKICIVEMLSPKNVRSFEYIRKEEVLRLVESIRTVYGSPINLSERARSFTSAVICRAAFGRVLKNREVLITLLREASDLASGFDLSDLFPSSKVFDVINWNKYKLLRMREKMDLTLDSLIEEHKYDSASLKQGNTETGGEDLVDVLLRLQKGGDLKVPLANDNIKAVLFDLFAAGTETTSTTVEWAMAELMKNPHVLAKAQAEVREAFKLKEIIGDGNLRELKYLKLVIKETLRMHPPIALLPRACREECVVDGYTIPLNSKVLINSWAIGRDSNYWNEPSKFMPERFEANSIDYLGNHYEYLPFGSGRRICPGVSFGLASVELPLAHLLYHFDWELPHGMKPCELDMSDSKGMVVGRKENLVVIPTPYNSSN